VVPNMPPREGQLGFLYLPPYRVQGISVAGEATVIQIPELDVCFDMGTCPRAVLSSPFVALSHAHMDHIGALPYWFSQRFFQKIGTGTCICHPKVAGPLEAMMRSWIDLELQKTPHRIVGLEPDAEIEVKNHVFLRAIATSHTSPSLGFALIERRSKLKDEFVGMPQDRLREIKASGTEITRTMEIPLVAYTGDTEMGPFLYRDEFAQAKVVITECTFFDPEHRGRAKIGKHLHVHELGGLLSAWKAEHVVIVHTSRRTPLSFARQCLIGLDGGTDTGRLHLLMDHRANRLRHEAMAAASAPDGAASSPLETTTEAPESAESASIGEPS